MSTDTTTVADELGMAVTRLARLLRQQAGADLTPTMRAAVGTIAREGPITLGELAAIEQVAPPTATKVVAKLEEQGLVEREDDPSDRRVVRVALSDAGRRWLDADRRRRHAWLAERIDALPKADRRRLHDAIEVLDHLVTGVDR